MVVTSHDVARLAGVSQPTVSRALRDSPKVSEETKRRVREAASALGYVPSETGRALSSGRTRRIGLLLTDLENQFYPHVIAPMHRELEALDYQLVLQTETDDTGRVAERLLANGLDGVLLATTTVDSVLPVRLRDRGFAVRRGETFPGLGPDWLRFAVRDEQTTDTVIKTLRAIREEA